MDNGYLEDELRTPERAQIRQNGQIQPKIRKIERFSNKACVISMKLQNYDD